MVSVCDSGESGICQKPELASIYERYELLTSETMSRLLLVSSLRHSMVSNQHILMSPDRLGTAIIAAHQEVGSSMLAMTPSDSIPWSSCLTFSRSGKGTLREVNSA